MGRPTHLRLTPVLRRLDIYERDCEMILLQRLKVAMFPEKTGFLVVLSDKQITCKSGYRPGGVLHCTHYAIPYNLRSRRGSCLPGLIKLNTYPYSLSCSNPGTRVLA